MSDRFLLKIDPPQPCMGSDENDQPCPRRSSWAEVGPIDSQHERQLDVCPYCWEHLEMCLAEWVENPTDQDIQMENFCTARFVVGHYGGIGSAEVVGRCALDSVPPPYVEEKEEDYEDEEDRACFIRHHFNDNAYYVTYRDEGGQEKRVCAVWSNDYLVWDIFEYPAKHT